MQMEFGGSVMSSVKLTTVKVTSCSNSLSKIGVICPAKPVLTEDLCVVQRKNFQ
jgi:hypothetical protein